MSFNPIDIRHDIIGAPMKEVMRRMGPSEQWTDESVLVAGYVGALTAAANLAIPFSLIQSGYRGNRYFTGLSVGYSSLGYPMPLFNYITPGSSAEKFGSKYGARLGAGVMSHVPPFSWYDPTMKIASHTKASWRGAGAKVGAKVGSRVAGRLIPGLGWGLLAYDVYDIAFNQSLWGFDF